MLLAFHLMQKVVIMMMMLFVDYYAYNDDVVVDIAQQEGILKLYALQRDEEKIVLAGDDVDAGSTM